jgi:sulfatase maturation enzyme AslB (radical SAM superfamily)
MNKMCPAPWISRVVHSDGTIVPCCYTQEQNIERLKQDFLNGIQPTQCIYCWYHEDKNLPSPRGDLINFAKNSSVDSVQLLSLNLGNYCNAECITCNGSTSSKRNSWAKKHSKIEYIASTISISNIEIDFNQYPDLKMLTLIGGEPMLHPDTKPLLTKLVESGLSKNIDISFNTNASIFDLEIITLLQKFRSILVTLSIDGGGKYFEYQRRPLLWNNVKDISLQWMEISESIIINYVVSAVSIWGFNEFVAWYDRLPEVILKKNPEVKFVHVNDKMYLTLNVLSEQQKDEWIEFATDHKFKQSIIDILSTTQFNKRLVSKLSEHITLEDLTAKVKFFELFPNWKFNV